MMKDRIRPAKVEDFPLIEAWRAAHFLEMQARQPGEPREIRGQKMHGDGFWVVLVRDNRPVAACCYLDFPWEKVRRIYDLYAAPGHALHGLQLGKIVEDMADASGFEIRCNTDPENRRFLDILARRGYEVTAIELRRKPQERTHHASSEPGAAYSTREA